MIADLQARLDAALAENERLKETNARLNRRCQCYERGLAEKVKNSRGRSIGRALAVAAFWKSEAENERLRAALRAVIAKDGYWDDPAQEAYEMAQIASDALKARLEE